MNYPKEYMEYLIHFHGDRDLFECHEILEAYWKAQPVRQDQWVVLIQIAVGLYHHRRGNRSGAVKMLQSAARRMTKSSTEELGLDFDALNLSISDRLTSLENGDAYEDINLPITDEALLQECLGECAKRGWAWQAQSCMNEQLIHRHILRNRSAVIQEREESLRIKKRNIED